VAIAREKIQTLADFWPLVAPILDGPADDARAREKWLGAPGREVLADARAAVAATEPFAAEPLEQALDRVVEARGARKRDVFQAVRVAVTGTTVSPGLPETMAVLGRDESLRRIDSALTA
jgi:glutamyl-tRNA synthetase